jgi:hypothetical protein
MQTLLHVGRRSTSQCFPLVSQSRCFSTTKVTRLAHATLPLYEAVRVENFDSVTGISKYDVVKMGVENKKPELPLAITTKIPCLPSKSTIADFLSRHPSTKHYEREFLVTVASFFDGQDQLPKVIRNGVNQVLDYHGRKFELNTSHSKIVDNLTDALLECPIY